MKKYSILSLSTFLLISSLNASTPAAQVNSAISVMPSLSGKQLAPAVPLRTSHPLPEAVKASYVKAFANNSPAASTPGAITSAPSSDAPSAAVSSPAQASSSSAVSFEKKAAIELTSHALSGYLFPTVLLNKVSGTEQTLLNFLRTHPEDQEIISDTTGAQKILASAVANLEKRTDTGNKIQDAIELMEFKKKYKIHIDPTAFATLSKILIVQKDRILKALSQD